MVHLIKSGTMLVPDFIVYLLGYKTLELTLPSVHLHNIAHGRDLHRSE